MNLPEILSAYDVEDLMTTLGRHCDRTNIGRALQQTSIEGVVAPERRGQPWRIPAAMLLDVVAAVLRRRDFRDASRSRWPVGPLGQYRLAAARLLMSRKELVELVPDKLRRAVRAEQREAAAAAAECRRAKQAEVERARRREQRQREQDEARLDRTAMSIAYYDTRMVVCSQRFDAKIGFDSPEYRAFFEVEWPTVSFAEGYPSWWSMPPDLLKAYRARLDPWLCGQAKEMPDCRDLLVGMDLRDGWPKR